MGKNNYEEKDAQKETHSSREETKDAWHTAREDAQRSGELPERAANKEEKSGKK